MQLIYIEKYLYYHRSATTSSCLGIIMKLLKLFWIVVLPNLFFLLSLTHTLARQFIVPEDGMFYVERKPAFTFKATLAENWVTPHAGVGMLHVFAPVLPELPGQWNVSTRLFISGNDKVKANHVVEASNNKRPMLGLHIKSKALSLKSMTPLRVTYEGTLFSRTLRWETPPKAVPELTEEQRYQYLMTSTTMDHNDTQFIRWIIDRDLERRKDEQTIKFAHRVFTYFVKNAKYGGDTSSYESRRPSRVCKSFENDCGGLALLFVAVMRANDVPARTLFGRWAIPQTDKYGQYHVMAEFFVPGSGWVPVDISGTIVHKPNDQNAFFGNTDGQFIVFHVDTDLQPAKKFRHAWAQYLLLKWDGSGDFWKEHRFESKWDVVRQPIEN